MAMTHDRSAVRQLQQRLKNRNPNWNPDEKCGGVHSESLNCEYNKQGQLIELHLCELRLTQLPSDVWQFSALQQLDLDCNELSILPREIGQLTSLQQLNLFGNQLNILPREIGQLTSLQRLDVESNQLSILPREIGRLTSLQWLNLFDNQLSVLPREIGQLTSLQQLNLDSNPLQIPPPDILAQGIPAILAYLRALPDKLETYLASQQQQLFLQQAEQTIGVFYSYAPEDEGLRGELAKHLSALRSQHLITEWHDQTITAGMEREQTVNHYLDTADLILLLVSPDFLASDRQYGIEVQRVMQRQASGEAHVVPILLRPVDLRGTPFASLPSLPSTGKPLTHWNNHDDAFVDVVQGLRAVIQEILTAHFQNGQEHLQTLHASMDTLRNPYVEVESLLEQASGEQKRLTNECLSIEAEIAALQQKKQELQNDLAVWGGVQQHHEDERQILQQKALSIRKEEAILEQEARQLTAQVKKVKDG